MVVNVAGLAGVKLRQFFWRKKVWLVLGVIGLATVEAVPQVEGSGA